MFPCDRIQERVTHDQALDNSAQEHLASCARCAAVAADWLALASQLQQELDAAEVPADFAERVMARIESDQVSPAPAVANGLQPLLGRRWVQLALTQVGVAAAVVNLLRLVLSTLVPTTSLGGTP